MGGSGDAAVGPDSAVVTDAEVGPDGGPLCVDQPLDMGVVWDTAVVPTQPTPTTDEFEVAGTVVYLGPITVPLASNPAFDREVQIQHGDGTVSTVQYYLPAGVTLPVAQGGVYTFWLRDRWGFEGSARGFVITRPTSGLPPLLFVGDTGSYGRAYDEEDPAMSPLKVYVEPRPECPATPDPVCGGNRYVDRLRFDSSTGGQITDVAVDQGLTADLPVFGDPWRVVNLASHHVDQPCLDAADGRVAYLAVNQTALPCDTSRFYVWDTPDAIGVGTYCDELFVCPSSQAQLDAIVAASPSVDCASSVIGCPPGGLACAWPAGEVDQSTYDELCAVSVLPDAPERIDCAIYF